MQVTETANSGLKRELKVVIDAGELDNKLEARLVDLKDKVQLKGFRPGKVPVNHLRRMYGRTVMAEILQEAVSETSRNALKERDERPAFEPEIALTEDKDEIEQIMDGKADLAYTMSFEILPDFNIDDFSKYEFEKPVAEVTDEERQKGIDRVLQSQKEFAVVDRESRENDRLTIDFLGKIDGEAFEGGAGEDVPLELGSGQFIPGFEEGLIGSKSGDAKDISCTFPEDYPEASLAGKEAVFEVKVKEVAEPVDAELTEELAKKLGFDSIDKFKETVSEKLQEELDQISRNRLKKDLLDKLEQSHEFELPEKLVTQEFESIWNQLTTEMESSNKSFDDEGTTEEEERQKYQDIAERRVRLGLVVSEVGNKNDLQVSEDEVQQALINRASQFPGQERQVLSFYQQNPQALAELRAPLYEEKVVNFILEMAKVKDKKISIEELTEPAEKDEETAE